MFKLKFSEVPAGKMIRMAQIAPVKKEIRYDDRLGPQGAEYIVDFVGKGKLHIEDVGNAYSPKDHWGIRINRSKVVHYRNDGELMLKPGNYENNKVRIEINGYSTEVELLTTAGTKMSHLEDDQYRFDVVMATTQESILANIKSYLDKTRFPTVRRYFRYGSAGSIIDFTDIYEKISGSVDPFSVPAWNGQGAKPANLASLEALRFAFAIEATAGLPKKSLEVFRLNADKTVNYKMGFSKLKIAELPRNASKYINVSQTSATPWILDTVVNLYQTNKSFLPENVRSALNELRRTYGDYSYVVKTVAMNFEAAAIKSVPTIPGLGDEAVAELGNSLKALFIKSTNESSVSVLNYNILNNPAKRLNANVLQITELKQDWSPYKSIDGETQVDLDTLNYYCGTDNKMIPNPKPFNWNWVEPTDEIEFNGVIAVSRGNFMAYMSRVLSEQLPKLDIVTNVWMSYKNDLVVKWTHSMGNKTGEAFKILPLNGKTPDGKAASLYYKLVNNSFNSTSWDIGISTAEGHFNYYADVEVAMSNKGITVTTTCRAWMDYTKSAWETGTAQGNIAKFVDRSEYELLVDDSGRLRVNRNQIAFEDQSEELRLNNLSKTQIEHAINPILSMKEDVKKAIKDAMANFATNLATGINSLQSWAFPGGTTFTFKDAQFSNFEDLIVHINYVNNRTMVKYGNKSSRTADKNDGISMHEIN